MTTSGPDQGPRRGVSRWLIGLLVLSLSANLALGGLVAGRWIAGHGRDGGDPELTRIENRALRLVPEAHRDRARALLLEARPDARAAADALVSRNQLVIDRLRAEPFDADALREAFAERGRAIRGVYGGPWDKLSALAVEMTPDERHSMADSMEAAHRRWVGRLRDRLD